MQRFLPIIYIFFSTLLFSQLFAYNADGHRIIALVAYEQLDEKTRTALFELLKHHPRFQADFLNEMPDAIKAGTPELQQRWLLSQAGVWPDIARGFDGDTRKRFHRSRWHWVNIPFFANEAHEAAVGPSIAPIPKDPFTGLDNDNYNIIQAIKNSLRILKDKSQPAELRALHICWLVHTVGDSHQPLHATALFSPNLFPKGDRGGNLIPIGQRNNLHSVWDGLLGRNRTFNRLRRDAAELLANEDLNSPDAPFRKIMSPNDWLQESRELAEIHTYTAEILEPVLAAEESGNTLEGITPGEDYYRNGGEVCRELVTKSGIRLGILFNEIFSGE